MKALIINERVLLSLREHGIVINPDARDGFVVGTVGGFCIVANQNVPDDTMLVFDADQVRRFNDAYPTLPPSP